MVILLHFIVHLKFMDYRNGKRWRIQTSKHTLSKMDNICTLQMMKIIKDFVREFIILFSLQYCAYQKALLK